MLLSCTLRAARIAANILWCLTLGCKKKKEKKNTWHEPSPFPFPFCLISGIFERELGQSFCRWSQHIRVSDSQPWEPDRAAVYAALGAARWKRIPRSPKHSSEGTYCLQGLSLRMQNTTIIPSEVLYRFLSSSSHPLILCLPLSFPLPPTPRFLLFALHPSQRSIYW